jgi:excisionase family DNA binding protein
MSLTERIAVSTSEAAKLSGYSESYIRRFVREGKLKGSRPTGRSGGDYRILVDDLREWLRGENSSTNTAAR